MAKPDLLTGTEAAEIVGVTPETIRRWAEVGRIPYIKLPSGHRRYRRSDVVEFVRVRPADPSKAAS